MDEHEKRKTDEVVEYCRSTDSGRKAEPSIKEQLEILSDEINHILDRPEMYVGGRRSEDAMALDSLLWGMFYSWTLFAGRRKQMHAAQQEDGVNKCLRIARDQSEQEVPDNGFIEVVVHRWRTIAQTIGMS